MPKTLTRLLMLNLENVLYDLCVFHYDCFIWCNKDFDNISFRNELRARLSVTGNYDEFEKVYLQVLNNHAPIKSKTVRANDKALRKAIMRRSSWKASITILGIQKWEGFIESKRIFAAAFIKKKERNIMLGYRGGSRIFWRV